MLVCREVSLTVDLLTDPPPPDAQAPYDPQGQSPEPYTFAFSQQNTTQFPGGTLKIADSTNFKVATTIAVGEVKLEPGAMREIHVSRVLMTRRSEL